MRLLALAAIVPMFLVGCSAPTEEKVGVELYDAACARCHAGDGRGTLAGPDIGPGSDSAIELSDDQLRGVIVIGPGTMPGFPNLTEEQVDSLVAHMRLLQRGP